MDREAELKKNNKVTIVTVVFNDVLNIENTILSVINQSYENVEYIIVDGGSDDGTVDVFTAPEDYAAVKDALDAAGLEATSAEVTMHPETTVALDVKDAEKALAMIDAFEDLDDVQDVYTNADFSDEIMAELSGE